MALDQDHVVDVAELLLLQPGCCLGLKGEVMLHRAGQKSHSSSESSWSLSFDDFSHFFKSFTDLSLLIVVSGGRNSHNRRLSQSRSLVAIISFPLADGSILSFLYSG
jgi:hypothetical protein